MKTLRTGIIGCGNVADFHAQALAELPSSSFMAVCNHHLDRAQSFAQKYGVKAYDDVETMIRECDLDVVNICTPHPFHAQAAVQAADLGCNVLIEKPLAADVKDCDRIIEAEERNQVTIGMITQRRYFRPCMRIRQAIDEGKIGKPVMGIVTVLGWRGKEYYDSAAWRGSQELEGGGVLINQAVHQLDLLSWYMGDVEEIYGVSKNFSHPYIDVEDSAVAVIRFKNGGVGSVVASNCQNPGIHANVHIFGDNGAGIGVQTDGGSMFIAGMTSMAEAPFNDLWTVPGEEKELEKWKKEDTEVFNSQNEAYYHKIQIEEFLNAVIKGERPMVDAREGKKSVEIFEGIYRSSAQDQPISVPFS